MYEKKCDRSLRIRTDGLREWKKETRYNRYEATPYEALDALFKVYKLQKSDEIVDFGCGRGRVAFYIHYHFQVPVTGVEVNEKTFEELLDNEASYLHGASHIDAPLRFDFALAEDYEIPPTANRFYFFNPFSLTIFKKVVNNILRSVKQNQRPVDIIFYYPLQGFIHYLEKQTPFRLFNKVRVPGAKDANAYFVIYRFE